jgi:cysteine desulfurase/selenocysteine lyase
MSSSHLMNEDAVGDLRGVLPSAPAGVPDVAALAQMATDFFRSAPGQAGPFGGNQFGGAQSAVTVPSMAPQFGATPSSMFSAPAAEKLLSEAGMQRLSGGDPSPFEPSLAAAPAPVNTTPYSGAGVPHFGASGSPATTAVSPFSQPMPSFESPFPQFGAALPAIPRMAALPTEADVTAALNSVSAFYFLEGAGALSKPAAAKHTSEAKHDSPAAAAIAPSLLPDLHLPRKQFDVSSVRRDFPILQERVNGKPLIWLDNAATTQKPQSVIERISYFYEHENSNIHRAAHELAARATDAYEDAREKVARFLNAPSVKEIVFVRGATEAINLVAKSWGKRHIGKDDEIVISWIEHHANIVPWQMLAAETGARLRVAPVDDDGQILLDEFERLLNPKTRLVSVTQVSNALGTITPTRQMVQMAHRYGAKILVDGAQSVSHMSTDVQALDCDFFVFSGHKVFGPTGIGVLYGKPDALAEMPPWQGGGNMIVDVTFEKTIYHAPPARFEAGTGNIADAVGLGAAIDYVEGLGMENIARHEHDLMIYATNLMRTIPGLRLIGTAKEKASVLSFVLEGYQTEDVGAALNREGIAVRSGHHCAQPALRRFGVETSVRPSLALYNNCEDVDAMIAVLRKLKSTGA